MGGTPKIKTPPVPPPPPLPQVSMEAEDWAMKKARKKKGFESTILTGALEPIPKGMTTRLG